MGQHLPAKLAYHGKIVLGSATFAGLFAFLRGEEPIGEIFLVCFFILWTQLEIFLWMGSKALAIKPVSVKKGQIKNSIYKLALFYMAVLVISLLAVYLILSIYFFIKGENFQNHLRFFAAQEFSGFIKLYVAGLLVGTICYFYFQWKDSLQREQRLQREKLLFQFETLKSQVNPHFLFNSLNTLSSLVGTDAQPAGQFIQRLSSLYHYILENRETEYVSLAAEIDFVKDFFYLQQVRDGNKIALSIEIEDPQQYKIFPISIQLLVENALKHNIATSDRPLRILIKAGNGSIIVKNNLQRKQVLLHSKKIGLNNLRERIKYSINREMEVIETNDEFTVIIPLIY